MPVMPPAKPESDKADKDIPLSQPVLRDTHGYLVTLIRGDYRS